MEFLRGFTLILCAIALIIAIILMSRQLFGLVS